MGWFRSTQGGVAWLAVFALACQLLLSFGHIHLGAMNSGSPLWAGAIGRAGASTVVPPLSPQKNRSGLPDEFCAVWANANLANNLVVPASPIVLPPGSITQLLPWSRAASVPISVPHLLFNARGPPHKA
jgi:hypothetical protein